MSWHPNDLLVDRDLAAYERAILTQFGESQWQAARTKTFEDWLFPILRSHGYDPARLRTRFEADAVLGYTSSVYADKSGAASDTTADDLNLATILATPASDYLYIGSARPFRGLFWLMADALASADARIAVHYWAGSWVELDVVDATHGFKSGGSVTWDAPPDWVLRTLSTLSTRLYWARVSVATVPTGAKAGQVSVVRASALRAPCTFRTLASIFREAPTSADGPWLEKAQYYASEADASLLRALPLIAGEFDSDGSDALSEAEADVTVAAPFSMERA